MEPPQRKMQEAEEIAPLPLDPVYECHANGQTFAPFRPRRTGLKELLHPAIYHNPNRKGRGNQPPPSKPCVLEDGHLRQQTLNPNILEEASHG